MKFRTEQQHLIDMVDGFKKLLLEDTYRRKASGYFGRLLRQPKLVEGDIVERYTLEDALVAALTPDEFRDIFPLGLLVTGQLRYAPESLDILLAVEMSSVVDKTVVSRAVHQAVLLRKAGYHALPVVVGGEVTQDGKTTIREQNVVLMKDEQVLFWKEALASWEGIRLAVD
jgi:hypothetical protein